MRHRSNYSIFRSPMHGFTLIELLVVISIIALLLSIIMPALGKVKYTAKETICRTNIRQWALISNVYAMDFNGRFPSFPSPRVANIWDVSSEFITYSGEYQLPSMANPEPCMMTTYGMVDNKLKYCPLAPGDTVRNIETYMDIWQDQGLSVLIGYSWWVPRATAGGTRATAKFPPDHPLKTTDRYISSRPIITDVMLAHGNAGPDGYATEPKPYPYVIEENMETVLQGKLPFNAFYTTHNQNGKLKKINMGFGDTHVESQKVSEIRNRYSGYYKNYY